jgi:hypothetical protein
MVRPRWRVEELQAGGENGLALPLAKHEPQTGGNYVQRTRLVPAFAR